jgi:hypothetical protein
VNLHKQIALTFLMCCMFIGAIGSTVACVTGCAEAKEYAHAGKAAVIDCGKEYAGPLLAAVARYGALAATKGKVDWGAVEKDALALGKEVGSCAVAAFLDALKKQPEPQVASLGGEPDVVVQGQAVLARLSGGAEVRLP